MPYSARTHTYAALEQILAAQLNSIQDGIITVSGEEQAAEADLYVEHDTAGLHKKVTIGTANSGVSLDIQANSGDAEVKKIRVRSSGGAEVFNVDEDGDVAVHDVTATGQVDIDSPATKFVQVKRTANGTDVEDVMRVARRGTAVYPSRFKQTGHFWRNHKHFREDWQRLPPAAGTETIDNSNWKLTSPSGTTGLSDAGSKNGECTFTTGATSGNVAIIRGWFDMDLGAAAVSGLPADENLQRALWVHRLVDTTNVHLQLGFGVSGGAWPDIMFAGFEVKPTGGLGGITNWVGSVQTAAATYTRVDTGIAVDANHHVFEMLQTAAGSFQFVIDGVLRCTVNATPSTTLLRKMVGISSGSAGAKQMRNKLIEWSSGHLL